MNEAMQNRSQIEKMPLGSMVAIDPESLPMGTQPDFTFHYIDISAAANGRLSVPDAPIEYREAPSRARRVIKSGDVLMSTVRPNLKAFAYCDLPQENFIASTGFAVLRALGENDSRYVLYSILSDDVSQQICSLTVGSNYPAINSSDVRRLKIPAFRPEEQRHIAEILSTLDEVIEQTETLIAKMQQVKAGLMHDLFTRGVTPDGHLRPTREQAPDLYKESPLGWIPKEWDVFETDAKVDVIDPQPDHRTPPEVLDGFPYVGIGDLTLTGELDFVSARKVAPAAFQKQLRSFEIHPGAFIFGKIGTTGQPTRIPHERFFAVSANVVLFTVKSKDDSDFVFWVYNSAFTEVQVADATNTTSQPALGIQRIRKFLLPWPESPEERNQIVSKLESISQTLQTEEHYREKLCLLKHGLMHDLLTGHVRVQ